MLVGLIGAKGAGKDTAASHLLAAHGFTRLAFADPLYAEAAQAYGVTVAYLANRETKEKPLVQLQLKKCRDKHFVEIALRELRKDRQMPHSRCRGGSARLVRQWINRELRKPRSPRWVLQVWGTAYRRQSVYGHDSYWLDQAAAMVRAHPHRSYVITDVRFINEARLVEAMGGILVRVRRPVIEEALALERQKGGVVALHPSETELLTYPAHLEVVNQEGRPEVMQMQLAQGLQERLQRVA